VKGWPFLSHPTGWFQIGWSASFPPKTVQPLRYFGEDLVLYRSQSGSLRVHDAFCPHLGANIGEGGFVDGDCVVCPWHGWRFNEEGRNTGIPYWDRTNARVLLRPWHVLETDGIVVLWYDALGRQPFWEWPGVPEFRNTADFYPVYPHGAHSYGPRRVKPQSVVETSADVHHFMSVHGNSSSAVCTLWQQDRHYHHAMFELPFGRRRKGVVGRPDRATTWMTPTGPTTGKLDQEVWGLGLGFIRLTIAGRITVQLASATPIDDDYSEVFSTIAASRETGDVGDVPQGNALRMITIQQNEFAKDFHIWEHQRYAHSPSYAGREERLYASLRRHFKQFYPVVSTDSEIPVFSQL
jgi:phenylpropionate dioxygenase-like ring-hydroxylating dioxygenase large terminal subunit